MFKICNTFFNKKPTRHMKALKIPSDKIETLKLVNKSELARQLKIRPQYLCMILSGKRKGRKYQGQILSYLKAIYQAA